jgi:hypothetical protein
MDRAHDLIAPYLTRDGVIGAYLVGSATRPHRDEFSDDDIEIIVEDEAYARTPDEERHVYVLRSEDPPIVDHEFYLIPWSDFACLAESSHDLFHYPYQHAQILFDPQGRLASQIERLRRLPEIVRRERLIVHYLGTLYALAKLRKVQSRGSCPVNLAIVRGEALRSMTKCLFLLHRVWPATPHWTMEELRLLGLPDDLLFQIERWADDPDSVSRGQLVKRLDQHLTDSGETFHQDRSSLGQWLLFTKDGKAAFERWGAR